MSWRGDRYKLNDHGQEQATNQRACQENGEIVDVLSVVVAEIPEREKRGWLQQPEISCSPLSRSPRSSHKKRRLRSSKRYYASRGISRHSDTPTPRSYDLPWQGRAST